MVEREVERSLSTGDEGRAVIGLVIVMFVASAALAVVACWMPSQIGKEEGIES